MSTGWLCDEHGCDQEAPYNSTDQWVKVTIEIGEHDYERHFCPVCWAKMMVRKVYATDNKTGGD